MTTKPTTPTAHATPTAPPGRHPLLALVLIIGLLLWQFGWQAVPAHLQGKVWSLGAAAMVAVLLLLVAIAWRSADVWAACGLGIVWALMTVGCSVAWFVAPWPVQPGQGRCSAAADMPLGVLAACAAAWIAGRIYSAALGANKGWP